MHGRTFQDMQSEWSFNHLSIYLPLIHSDEGISPKR